VARNVEEVEVEEIGVVPDDGYSHARVRLEAEREDGDDDEEDGNYGSDLEKYSKQIPNPVSENTKVV